MAKRPRSHGLDERLEALGYRLIRQEPEKHASWAIIPTRRRGITKIQNLDAVQSIVEQMEEELWLEFGRWLKEHYPIVEASNVLEHEIACAKDFLISKKHFEDKHVAAIIRSWYEPTE